MLTTLRRFKKHMVIEEDSQDDVYTMYILAASQAIESYCRRSFRRQVYREVIDGSGTGYLVLRNFPIYSGTATVHGKSFAIEASDDGLLYLPEGWPPGTRNVMVEYEAGYTLPFEATEDKPSTLPEAVEVACLFMIEGMTQNPSNVQSERIGDISVTYRDADGMLSPTVKALLAPYVGRWV